jgi:uncharacterized protein YndB with AHSA1/START domain
MSEHDTTTEDRQPPADDPRGTLGVGEDGQWQIRFQRRLRHSPERVWAALTDPTDQAAWAPGVTIDATEGGAVVFDFGDEGRADGRVLAADPPRVLEHTWLWPGEPESTVRWELSADGDGTLLVLWHRPVREEPAVSYCTGWHAMLDALAVLLDGGDPGGLSPDYDELFMLYSPAN